MPARRPGAAAAHSARDADGASLSGCGARTRPIPPRAQCTPCKRLWLPTHLVQQFVQISAKTRPRTRAMLAGMRTCTLMLHGCSRCVNDLEPMAVARGKTHGARSGRGGGGGGRGGSGGGRGGRSQARGAATGIPSSRTTRHTHMRALTWSHRHNGGLLHVCGATESRGSPARQAGARPERGGSRFCAHSKARDASKARVLPLAKGNPCAACDWPNTGFAVEQMTACDDISNRKPVVETAGSYRDAGRPRRCCGAKFAAIAQGVGMLGAVVNAQRVPDQVTARSRSHMTRERRRKARAARACTRFWTPGCAFRASLAQKKCCVSRQWIRRAQDAPVLAQTTLERHRCKGVYVLRHCSAGRAIAIGHCGTTDCGHIATEAHHPHTAAPCVRWRCGVLFHIAIVYTAGTACTRPTHAAYLAAGGGVRSRDRLRW